MDNVKTVALILNAPTIDTPVTEEDVIVADGGLRHIKDKSPIAVIGDFDSLGYVPTLDGAEIIVHPVEKDATDGELAVDYAVNSGYDAMVIYGISGGRIDQILGNVNLLPYAYEKGLSVSARTGAEELYFTKKSLTLSVCVGDTVSILPYGGDARVTASGLQYPLDSLTLKKYSSRGISNKAVSGRVTVTVETGAIIVVRSFSR